MVVHAFTPALGKQREGDLSWRPACSIPETLSEITFLLGTTRLVCFFFPQKGIIFVMGNRTVISRKNRNWRRFRHYVASVCKVRSLNPRCAAGRW